MFCKTCNKHISPTGVAPSYFSLDGYILCRGGYFGAEEEQTLRLKVKKVAREAIQRTVIDAISRDVSLMSASDIAELISGEVMMVIKREDIQPPNTKET